MNKWVITCCAVIVACMCNSEFTRGATVNSSVSRHRAAIILPQADVSAPATILFDDANVLTYDIPANNGVTATWRFAVITSVPLDFFDKHKVIAPTTTNSVAGDVLIIDNRTNADVWVVDPNRFNNVSPAGPYTYTVSPQSVLHIYFDGGSWRKW